MNTEISDQFRSAIMSAGLNPPEHIVADGLLHRFGTNGKSSDTSGWYCLHGDGLAAGAFGCWRSDISETWRADIGRELSAREWADHAARMKAIKMVRDSEERERRAEARQRAADIWSRSKEAPEDHGYLLAKGIKPHGLRVHGGRLVVPMRDANSDLHSLQFIDGDGSKRFLTGGRVSGCYYAIGKPGDVLCIAEGFATGASVHEATGYAVAVAFNAGNLSPVAKMLRGKFPDSHIELCADDDARTAGNPGLTKAREAAAVIGAVLAVPDFGSERPEGATDFNDLHRQHGLAAVKSAIESATAQSAPHTVELLCAADVQSEPIKWLWPGWLAAGKLHVLAGPAGVGKTTIALNIAATVTTGGTWPDTSQCARPGQVLIWSAEDGIADTIVPRLRAAGADLGRVRFVERTNIGGDFRSFDPATDIPLLEQECSKLDNVRLLIVDPIVSAVAANSHNNAETRRALQPLVDFADRIGAAVLGISHFTKGTKGREPLERVTGSLAFGALARVVWGVTKGEDDERLLVRVKSNIGLDGGGFNYALEYPDMGGGVIGSRVVWGGAVEGDARTLMATAEMDDEQAEDRSERQDACDWLREVLADGPVPAKDLKRWASDAGHAWRTVERAKKAAGVVPRKSTFAGGWRWGLETKAATEPQERQPKGVAFFDHIGGLRGNTRLSNAIAESIQRTSSAATVNEISAYLTDWPSDDLAQIVEDSLMLDSVLRRMNEEKFRQGPANQEASALLKKRFLNSRTERH